MGHLQNENIKKCVSLLQEFMDEAEGNSSKKGMAILALDQLLRISAGEVTDNLWCRGNPIADSPSSHY
jgi:hypothetical protein